VATRDILHACGRSSNTHHRQQSKARRGHGKTGTTGNPDVAACLVSLSPIILSGLDPYFLFSTGCMLVSLSTEDHHRYRRASSMGFIDKQVIELMCTRLTYRTGPQPPSQMCHSAKGVPSPRLSVPNYLFIFLPIWWSYFGDQAASQQLHLGQKTQSTDRRGGLAGWVGLLPPARLALLP